MIHAIEARADGESLPNFRSRPDNGQRKTAFGVILESLVDRVYGVNVQSV